MFVLSPLREFSFIFRCKVCSAAGGNIKKLEILPRLHFYLSVTEFSIKNSKTVYQGVTVTRFFFFFFLTKRIRSLTNNC